LQSLASSSAFPMGVVFISFTSPEVLSRRPQPVRRGRRGRPWLEEIRRSQRCRRGLH
jgi:hypothetical protein